MKNIYLKISIIFLFFTCNFVGAQSQSLPLVRYYSYNTKRHFYTTQNDVPAGYVSEGILCYVSYPGPVGGTSTRQIYVLTKSTGQRLLTVSYQERDSAIYNYGYTDAGTVGYTFGAPYLNATVRVYRYYNASKQDYFYTNNYNELGAGGAGYTYEGIAW